MQPIIVYRKVTVPRSDASQAGDLRADGVLLQRGERVVSSRRIPDFDAASHPREDVFILELIVVWTPEAERLDAEAARRLIAWDTARGAGRKLASIVSRVGGVLATAGEAALDVLLYAVDR